MEIQLQQLGKKYNREWIFRGIDHVFSSPGAQAILGSNGSGKSTLLQVLSGRLMQTEGSILFSLGGKPIPVEQVFRHYAMATPYQELIEEYTLDELFHFQAKLKAFRPGISLESFTSLLALPGSIQSKTLRYYSSGMKQRVKLALAILSDVPLVLLDEPCSNLDRQGMEWYQQLVLSHATDRLFVVCSNHQQEEISFCSGSLLVNDYK